MWLGRLVGAAIALAVVSPAFTGATVAAAPQRDSAALALYNAYVSDGPGVLGRRVGTRDDWQRVREGLLDLVDDWRDEARERARRVFRPEDWQPSRLVFTLELGIHVFPGFTADGVRLLERARDLATARPGLPGAEKGVIDAADRLEVAVHRAAVGVLHQLPGVANAYLGSLGQRLAAFRRTPDGARLVARLVLARGIAAEGDTRPFARESPPARTERATAFQGNPDLALRLEHALDAFEDAPEGLPDLSAEIALHRGLIAFRLGREPQAQRWIEESLRQATDPAIRYCGWLFRGRILLAGGQWGDGVAALQSAHATWPHNQTAALMLATAYLERDQMASAERWARVARSMPADGVDPWWTYWFGDQRFLPGLMAEIRGIRP